MEAILPYISSVIQERLKALAELTTTEYVIPKMANQNNTTTKRESTFR